MSVKQAFCKSLEYTPFLGIIPGVIRFCAVVSNNPNAKVSKIAVDVFGMTIKTNGNRSTKILYITRSVASCLPVANMSLMSWDVLVGFVKTYNKNGSYS